MAPDERDRNPYSPPSTASLDYSDRQRRLPRFWIRLVAILMAAQGAYSLYSGWGNQPAIYFAVIFSLAAFVAAIGLWCEKRWSQYFVFAVSAVVLAVWVWGFGSAIQQGRWPYERLVATIVGLLISLPPIVFAIGSSVVAFRFFRRHT